MLRKELGKSLSVLLLLILSFSTAIANELRDLRVAVISSDRIDAFVPFLKSQVASVESFKLDEFDPKRGSRFDVVLLDWQQASSFGSGTGDGFNYLTEERCPLGERDAWDRPTVLIGSAGMRLSCKWAVRGSRGCTCLDPFAYDLREHQIFETPFKIDRKAVSAEIAMPPGFKDELAGDKIEVVRLVESGMKAIGFCTYPTGFDDYPEIEFICGGVNDKTPTAAAIWRQGNLLHFGFNQTFDEMNDVGDQILLNSIAYISNFSQDRPIAISPSPFVGTDTRPRMTIAKWLDTKDRASWVKNMVTPETWEIMSQQGDNSAMVAWAKANTPFFRPAEDGKMEIDPELASIQIGFDHGDFFRLLIEDLESKDANMNARATKLISRYAPEAPQDGTSRSLKAWHIENQPYLFATDLGHVRWYIDPLAKKRGIPTKDLHGKARMDK
jgi:hypothetical protein